MPLISDVVLDAGLNAMGATVRVDICSSEPATYAAIAGATVGNATGISVGAVGNASSGTGRSRVVAAVSGGTVTSDAATASHWCVSDGVSEIYAAGALTSSQVVYTANDFNLDTIEVFLRDATAV